MRPRSLSILGFCFSLLLVQGCDVKLTGLDTSWGLGGGCCYQPPPPCTTSCVALDPVTDQRMLLGDTIEVFFRVDGEAATWSYDSTALAETQPVDFVTHRTVRVSHISLQALATGLSTVTAKVGTSEATLRIETIPRSSLGGTGVTTIRCFHTGITDPSCTGTVYPWDTASFKTGDSLRVVSTSYDNKGGIVAANARWTTSNPAVAIVSRAFSDYYTKWLPIVIATGPGTATITGSVDGFAGSADVTVVR